MRFYYQEESDEVIKASVVERLKHLDPEYEQNEKILKVNHLFFRLLMENFDRHSKLVESANRVSGCTQITSENAVKVIFGTFMKQPASWRNVS